MLLRLRQARSRPILDDIRAYLEAGRPKVLPKSPEGQAMAYTLSNWAALVRYCQDGDLEIDNNGGRTAAVLNRLIATCKRLHLDPLAYLREVFERISAHPKNRLEKLLPDQWAAARAP